MTRATTSTGNEPAPTDGLPTVAQGVRIDGGPTPSSARGLRRYRIHHWLMMITGWCLLAIVGYGLNLRYRPVEHSVTIAVVGLFPLLTAPLVVAVIMALGSRSPVLRTATAVVTAAFVITVNPFDAVIGCGPTAADDEIRLMTANVLFEGGVSPDDLAATINTHQPDVFVLQEASWEYRQALAGDPSLDSHPHRTTDFETNTSGVMIWSRWPLSPVADDGLGEVKRVTADIESPYGSFVVTDVHTTAPSRQGNVASWLGQFEQLSAASTDRPAVLAGDFNATDDHYPFRQLLGQGWTDIHDNKGCGPDTTWPAAGLPVPIYRLDHVLLTDHFEPLGVELLDPKGSDHKPVLATFRFADR